MGFFLDMSIKGAIKELEKAKSNLFSEAVRISKKEKDVILNFIREKQLLEKGIDGDGNKLKEYKPFTIAFKVSFLPCISSDLIVNNSCKVYAAPKASKAQTSISPNL